MVRSYESSAHKQSGVGSSISSAETFFAPIEKQTCTYSLGQYHSGSVHQQTRGDSFFSTLSTSLESLVTSTRESDFFDSSSYSRGKECIGRPVEQDIYIAKRMVTKCNDSSKDISNMGNSDYRPVCDRTQSENTGVLCLDSPDNSIGTGLPLNLVGEHVCICIPSDKSDSEGLETHAEISMRGNSDCPTLAQTALVSNATSVTNSPAIEITGDTRVTESGKDKDISRKRSKSQTDCMASIDKQFKTKGFSKNARKLLAASWRSGTQKDYKCKFRKFYSWCREREIDPYLASLDICANFLTSLFDKGLKYRTIAGYRSMLSSVLPPIDNVRVGQHPYIIRLLKGVFNSRPGHYWFPGHQP